MNYSKRVDTIFGAVYSHRTLRTIFDCGANEWGDTLIPKKVEILEKIINSSYPLDSWIKDYIAFYKELKKPYVVSAIPQSLNILFEHTQDREVREQIQKWLNNPNNIPKTKSEKIVEELLASISKLENFKIKRTFEDIPFPAGSTVDFPITKSENELTRQHIGATIIDAILSAGSSYESAVRPRVEKFRKEFVNAKTTSSFLEIINNNDIEKLIEWKGFKIERIKQLANFLKLKNIETEADFKTWLNNTDNREEIKKINGIKDNTINYLQILCGNKQTVSVNNHIIRFFKDNSHWKPLSSEKHSQISIEAILESVATNLKIDVATLDHTIWEYMSQKKNYKNETMILPLLVLPST